MMGRYKIQNHIAVLVFIGFTLSIGSVQSEEPGRAGYAGSAMRMGIGAGPMAMGGGSVAWVHGAYAAYYNPASLVFLESRQASTMLNTMALDRTSCFVGYAQPLEGKGGNRLKAGFAAGWLCAGVNNIDGRDYSGNHTEMYSAWEHGFFFSFAINPAPPISIGLSGKLLYSRLPGLMDDGGALAATGFGFDFGVMVRPFRGLAAGFVIKDINSRYTWDTQDLFERGTKTINRYPRIVRGGVSYTAFSGRAGLSVDVEKVEFAPAFFHVGCQVECLPGAFLRGGLKDGGITAGAGYRHAVAGRFLQMDYAYVPDPIAPRGSHVFSWTFLF